MDNQLISKEILINSLKEAICHINRNLYEWTTGMKKGKIKFTITFSEVKGLARNWLVRSLRDKIGHGDADRMFRGMYITVEPDNSAIKNISLSYDARHSKGYFLVNEILNSMNFKHLQYNPDDYVMNGMSARKETFDPFFYISFQNIQQITF